MSSASTRTVPVENDDTEVLMFTTNPDAIVSPDITSRSLPAVPVLVLVASNTLAR